MGKYLRSAITGSALMVAAIAGAATVAGMPVAVGSAQETINQLQDSGFRVIVNKVGTGTLDQCIATAVRPGRDVTERAIAPGSDGTVERVAYTTVYVDVKC
ncbi:MAG: hypothetical protein U5N53_15160 [Mycobacterium sp.]|nr:hypothetical protein [Mycobacterium sp.]